MSEFKFSVGDRVVGRTTGNEYFKGTIKEILGRIYPYLVEGDENEYSEWCEDSELTRLVKKNPWGEFKVGQRVLVDTPALGKIAGTIIRLNKLLDDSPSLRIRLDKEMLNPFGSNEWSVNIGSCKLIEGEKPKRREPLRVGERVIVRHDGNLHCKNSFGFPLARSGDKGKITETRLVDGELFFNVILDGRHWRYFKREHLKRLIKKPVVFNVGDKVRIKKVFNKPDIEVPFISRVKDLYDDAVIVYDTKYKRDWHIKKSDCVRLRKKPTVFAVGDRVVCDGQIGTIAIDDKSWGAPFLFKPDDHWVGEYWTNQASCKRLVRKKRKPYAHRDPRVAAYYEESAKRDRSFFERLFSWGEKESHVPASGKKVDGEKFCECGDFILTYKQNNPTVCARCSKLFKPDVIPITTDAYNSNFAQQPGRCNRPEKEKHVCNPALWETQHITNIAQSKLINELIRKVERIEATRTICGRCLGFPTPHVCARCDGAGVEKN